MRLSLALGVMMAPVVALANCPTNADMATGVRFTVDTVDTETFRAVRPGVVEAIYQSQDYAARNLLGQGIYLLELVDLVNGDPDLNTRVTYAFAETAEDLPVPAANSTLTFKVLVSEGGSFETESQSYTMGAATAVSFGACSYDMIPIEVRYSPDEDNTVDVLHYLPELGFAYFAESRYGEGERDVFSYQTIEAVR